MRPPACAALPMVRWSAALPMILDLMPNDDDKPKITAGMVEFHPGMGGSGGQHTQPDGLGECAQLLEHRT